LSTNVTRCAHCRAESPADANFCPACGRPVTSTTAALGHTPRHLTERILAERGDLIGERKQVTVLFADIVGSTALVREMDPEQASALITPAIDAMMAAVHRYEGTVVQVAGDGIMALFGAPLATEDHAVRACYAALEIAPGVARASDGRMQVRVGLHSGEVLVKSIETDLSIDYTAIGATVHLAARLEKAAEPATVLATTATVDLARGYLDSECVGRIAVDGYAGPVEVHRLRGARAVRGTWQARSARKLTPFVARSREMTVLRQAREAAASGRGAVVAVVGPPGVGKSRLTHEFLAVCRRHGTRVLTAGATPYDTLTPYHPLKDLIRAWAGVRDGDVEPTLRRSLDARGGAAPGALSALTALLDAAPSDPVWADLDPRQRRREIRNAVRAVLLAEAATAPLVVVIEDLHWIDSETQAVLDELVASDVPSHLSLVVTYRPEYQERWTDEAPHALIDVEPLRDGDAGAFLRALVGDDPSVAALGPDLVARSEGTPLFLEEWVAALAEEGLLIGGHGAYRLAGDASEVAVPGTVQTILAARVDRLAPHAKAVLRVASVIGEQVPLELLAPLCPVDDLDGALDHLTAAEFLYLEREPPDAVWVFKHNLVREVVYASAPLELRRRLHGQVADLLATIHPDQTQRLAHHAWHAERWSAAARYSRAAGDSAIERSAYPSARRFYDLALRALEKAPQDRAHQELAVDVRLAQRVPVMATGGELADSLAQLSLASTTAAGIGDGRREALAEIHRSYAASTMGDNHIGVQAGEAALKVARDIDDAALSSEARIAIAQAHVYAGRWKPVPELLVPDLDVLLSDEVRLDRRGQAATRSMMSLSHVAHAYALAGDDDRALAYLARAEQVARESGRPLDRCHVLWTAGAVHRAANRADEAVSRLDRGHALAAEHELTFWTTLIGPELVAAVAAADRRDEAADLLPGVLAGAMATGFPMHQTRALVHAAEVTLVLGAPAHARDHAQEALRRCAGLDHPLFEALALRWLGMALHALGEHDRARRELAGALRLAESLDVTPLITALRSASN
jgi:class 3 adenylate cyclase/tetratricopeptide (TPR) repeat protein